MTNRPARRLTIRDIADMAGVSKTTVSFYLNGKTERMSLATQEKITEAIEKTGYKPSPLARGLNDKDTRLLGIIIGNITNSFSNILVKAIDHVVREDDYRVLVCNSSYDTANELAIIDQLLALGVDGFVLQPTAQSAGIHKMITEAGKELVCIDSRMYDTQTHWVKANNYEASFQAVSECIQRGYKRFLLITANPGLISSRVERVTGFADALKEHGLSYDEFILQDEGVDRDQVVSFVETYFDKTTPTLIFVANCWALADIYVALRPFYEHMPRLGLLGFDNTEWVRVATPSVSVVCQPADAEGTEAGRILLEALGDRELEIQHQELDCTISWGDSTF
ncbi:LacI family DNA-binding transcriptional regulator [Collinsella sp. zg1085]|uniref:LacI family DNA-binding transcriptional regulator n=1 Tax=Collinsella sp. zg1085 TaxID=2844380 RepID=UPI001C0AFFEC|nr:LacI family DNA-binding transcriptional regulator [Collinsella sp. zg1085]QWT17823.1 LacI family DNA-binding transcriptional regulator [Collinsella sp. zg1085]